MQGFSNNHPALFVPFFIIFFISLWCFVCFLLGVVSGWVTLAAQFRCTSEFKGPSWSGRSGYMRWVNFNRILTVGADSSGLFLRMMFLFRIGQPPLLIPWNHVTISKRGKIFFFRYVVLRLGREEQIPLAISGNLTDKIQAAAGSSWPVEAIS